MAAAPVRKVVIVTGASSGVGLALSVLLSGTGQYKVYATARQPNTVEQLQQLVKERPDTLELLPLDVTKEDTITQAVNHILQKDSKIDVLVNNAGFSFAKNLEATSMAEFKEIFDTNFFGVVATSKAVVPHMREAKSGHIINIASYGGLVGQPFNDAYCAAKFAVSGLTESMHATLSPLGVKVTLVCPGAITTPFLAKASSSLVAVGDENPYSTLQTAYMDTMKKIFMGNAAAGIKTSQTPEEIAEVLKKIIETDKPNFQYPTSEYMTNLVAKKYVDPTGNTNTQLTLSRCYGDALNTKV
jgi:NAD(P)-dependent dehydrogenase (short-subunit alcohol dehydrogenase family)